MRHDLGIYIVWDFLDDADGDVLDEFCVELRERPQNLVWAASKTLACFDMRQTRKRFHVFLTSGTVESEIA